ADKGDSRLARKGGSSYRGSAQAGPPPFLELLRVFVDELLERFGRFLGVFVDNVAQDDLRGRGGAEHDDRRDRSTQGKQRDQQGHQAPGTRGASSGAALAATGAGVRAGPRRGRRGATAPPRALEPPWTRVALASTLVASVAGAASWWEETRCSTGEMPSAPSLIARPISRAFS